MKKQIAILVSLILLYFVSFSQVKYTGTNSQPKSITGSKVELATGIGGEEVYTPGVQNYFIFYAYSNSPDFEYVYNLWLRFPDSWVVDSAVLVGTPTCSNGSWGTFSYTVLADNEIKINHPRYQGDGGCYCEAFYKVYVKPSVYIGDASISWYWDGDGYALTPHNPCSSDGYTPTNEAPCDEQINPTVIIPCNSDYVPSLLLEPKQQTVKSCINNSENVILTLTNKTGAANTIDLYYNIVKGQGVVSGPTELLLDSAASQSFSLSIEAELSMHVGDTLEVEVKAVYNGIYDTSTFYKVIVAASWTNVANEPNNGRMDNVVASYNNLIWSITGQGENNQVRYYDPSNDTWTSIENSEPPFGTNYARSGSNYGSKVYIYGDAITTGFTGLWSYDMISNTWTNLTPSGTAPSQTSIWAPSFVTDYETGYVYITGGATTPGGGDLATVYVYDAVNNQWLSPLPNFTTARDFHAAFIFTDIDGHKKLAIAGGISSSSLVYSSTQCYDFTNNSWNAENADLGELPSPIWSMGYTHNIKNNNSQLWFVGGASASFQNNTESFYFDVTNHNWVDAGVYDQVSVYRTSATSLNGFVYKLGGSTGGFTPTGKTNKYGDCAIPYTVTFNVSNGTNQLEGVNINVNNKNISTNTNGLAYINLTNGAYLYTATLTGYNDYPNVFVVENQDVEVSIIMNHVAIDDKNYNISIFPNPSNGIINIKAQDFYSIEILDIYGRIVLSENIKNLNYQIDITSQNSGIYFIKLSNEKSNVIYKITKK